MAKRDQKNSEVTWHDLPDRAADCPLTNLFLITEIISRFARGRCLHFIMQDSIVRIEALFLEMKTETCIASDATHP